jgi:hypothetical protein
MEEKSWENENQKVCSIESRFPITAHLWMNRSLCLRSYLWNTFSLLTRF